MLALALATLMLAGPLPDLDQATPFGISIVARGNRSLLVFGSAVDNVGRGPLVVEGRWAGNAMRTWQLVGGDRVPIGVRLRYVRSETHRHWHFPAFERYELRRLGGPLAGRDRKTGFCLRDAYETRPLGRPPRWTTECGRGRPRAQVVREGISPGFGDDYVPMKEGQSIDVTGLRGRFVLVHRANPDRVLLERSYRNNAASVLVELGRGQVRILRRCSSSAACGT